MEYWSAGTSQHRSRGMGMKERTRGVGSSENG